MRRVLPILILALGFECSAAHIVNVTRRLRMSSKEPVPAKDFYFDLGSKDGLRDGDVVSVYRMLPVMNAMSGVPELQLRLPIGEIKVVTAGERVSVGRLQSIREPGDLPALESPSFMMGDMVQIKSGLPFR